MAHTDAHVPYWVTAPYQAEHTDRCVTFRDECDLPPRPVRSALRTAPAWSHGWHRDTRCAWSYTDDRRYADAFAPVPKWYRDHRWNNRVRVAVRDRGRRAVAEHRATGDVAVELPVEQHRHGATWDWH